MSLYLGRDWIQSIDREEPIVLGQLIPECKEQVMGILIKNLIWGEYSILIDYLQIKRRNNCIYRKHKATQGIDELSIRTKKDRVCEILDTIKTECLNHIQAMKKVINSLWHY